MLPKKLPFVKSLFNRSNYAHGFAWDRAQRLLMYWHWPGTNALVPGHAHAPGHVFIYELGKALVTKANCGRRARLRGVASRSPGGRSLYLRGLGLLGVLAWRLLGGVWSSETGPVGIARVVVPSRFSSRRMILHAPKLQAW